MNKKEFIREIKRVAKLVKHIQDMNIAIIPPEFTPLLIIKVPHLNQKDSEGLLDKLKKLLPNVKTLVIPDYWDAKLLPEIHLHMRVD